MSTNSQNVPAGQLVTSYMSAAAGVGLVIVDVDKDGQIEDGDTAVLVRNHHASVTDIAFGKQEINYAWGDPHMGQADESSGYTGAMEDQLRQLAQNVYDQLRNGQNADGDINAFVGAVHGITSNGTLTDQKFDFHNDIGFMNRNGVRTVFDVKHAGGNVAVTENVDVLVSEKGSKTVAKKVEFDNLWLDQAGDMLSGGTVVNATQADQKTTLPIIRAVSGGHGGGGYNYALTTDNGKSNYLFNDLDWTHLVRSDGSIDTASIDFVNGFVKRTDPNGSGWYVDMWASDWMQQAFGILTNDRERKTEREAGR